jgi:hypothetical protein
MISNRDIVSIYVCLSESSSTSRVEEPQEHCQIRITATTTLVHRDVVVRSADLVVLAIDHVLCKRKLAADSLLKL